MNHTQTYQLNQWDPDDRILREDFNADNQKLESALGIKLQHETIREVVTEELAKEIAIDISDISFGDWKYIIACVNPPSHGTSSWAYSSSADTFSNSTCKVLGISSSYSGLGRFEYWNDSKFTAYCIVFPFHNANQYLRGITISNLFCAGFSKTETYDSLQYFKLLADESSAAFAAGTKITFWGVK